MKPYTPPVIKKDFQLQDFTKQLAFAVLEQANVLYGSGEDIGETIMFKCGDDGCKVGRIGSDKL